MTLYTFYCNRADGSPLSLESAELCDDARAREWAARVMADHRSCQRVEVFDQERLVLSTERPETDAQLAP